MGSVARFVLIWMLAVALPLQGVSAATMAVCGVGLHQLAALEEASKTFGGNAETAGPIHEHHVHGAGHAHAVAGSASNDKTHAGHAHAHKCSACASCCFNAAVPTASLSFDAAKSPDHFAPFVAPTPLAVVGDGLERPPRPLLA